MRHIFVVNPMAGKHKARKQLVPKLNSFISQKGLDAEIYITTGVGDCERFVRERSKSDELIRFYACGGDGTLGEATNGIFGAKNKELAVIPIGTGNDFVRSFNNKEFFSELENQVEGSAEPIDLICCKTDSRITYSINMINIGFDCDVAAKIQDLKRLPLISGSFSYYLGIIITLFSRMGKGFSTKLSDKTEHRGEYLLVSVGNGSYCGGGFCASPKSDLKDGLLDLMMVKKVSRLDFISLIGRYKVGEHIEEKYSKGLITYLAQPSVTIEPLNQMKVCIDGEIFNMEKMELSTVGKAVLFSIPKGSSLKIQKEMIKL